MPSNDMSIKELYDLLKKSQEEQTEKLMNEMHKNSEEHNKKLEKNEKDIKQLQDDHLNLERRIRKNNIIVFGINVHQDNITHETLEILNKSLGISLHERDINNIYLVGRQENRKGVLIELVSYLTKKYIFQNTTKLRNTKISIVDDLCPEDRQTRKILVKNLKAAKNKNQRARIRGLTLQIEGRTYTAKELDVTDTESELESSLEEETKEELEKIGVKAAEVNTKEIKRTISKNQKEREKRNYKKIDTQVNTRLAGKYKT